VHKLFCKRVMGVSLTSTNDVCINEMWMKNGKQKVLERVMKHCLRAFDTYETNPVGCTGKAKRGGGKQLDEHN
jgi:hypothetical protein